MHTGTRPSVSILHYSSANDKHDGHIEASSLFFVRSTLSSDISCLTLTWILETSNGPSPAPSFALPSLFPVLIVVSIGESVLHGNSPRGMILSDTSAAGAEITECGVGMFDGSGVGRCADVPVRVVRVFEGSLRSLLVSLDMATQ